MIAIKMDWLENSWFNRKSTNMEIDIVKYVYKKHKNNNNHKIINNKTQ